MTMKLAALFLSCSLLWSVVTANAECGYQFKQTHHFDGSASQATYVELYPLATEIPVVYDRTDGDSLSVLIETDEEIRENDYIVQVVQGKVIVNVSEEVVASLRDVRAAGFAYKSYAGRLDVGHMVQILTLSQLHEGRLRRLGLGLHSLYYLSKGTGVLAQDSCPRIRVKVALPKYRCEYGEDGAEEIEACRIVPEVFRQSEGFVHISFVTPYGVRFNSTLARTNPYSTEGESILVNESNQDSSPLSSEYSGSYSSEQGSITLSGTGYGSGIIHIDNQLMRIEIESQTVRLSHVYTDILEFGGAVVPPGIGSLGRHLVDATPSPLNCKFQQGDTWVIKLGLVVTYKLLERFNFDRDAVRAWVESVVANANYVFGHQLGINFLIHRIILKGNAESGSGKEWNSCKGGPFKRLDSFAMWLRGQKFYSKRTVWHLMADCFFETGVIGVAYRNSLCSGWGFNAGISNYEDKLTWVSFAHETGHILGAKDAPKSGIMSRGTKYNGIFQFNAQVSRNALCRTLNLAMFLQKCKGIVTRGTWAPTGSPSTSPTIYPTPVPTLKPTLQVLQTLPSQPQTTIQNKKKKKRKKKSKRKKKKKKKK